MSVWYGYVLAALWLGWAAYWAITSVGGKPVARSESWQSRLGYSVPLWIAAVLLLSRHMPYPLGGRILPVANCTASVGVILTAAGLGFAIWARIHLGTNWSADVTVKEGHELVRSGPYALARHPHLYRPDARVPGYCHCHRRMASGDRDGDRGGEFLVQTHP
jgi:hypothetical protein